MSLLKKIGLSIAGAGFLAISFGAGILYSNHMNKPMSAYMIPDLDGNEINELVITKRNDYKSLLYGNEDSEFVSDEILINQANQSLDDLWDDYWNAFNEFQESLPDYDSFEEQLNGGN